MAAAAAAALLDELMGRQRNIDPTSAKREPKWDDEEICKWYLCGFCPHDLFTNTRADLGTCDRIHDDEMREAYQKSKRYEKCGYEDNFLRYLKTILQDVERRIRRGQDRLALNNTQNALSGNQPTQDERIELLTQRINELVRQAEELGCEGKVEEAQGVLKLCDKLKEDRAELQSGVQRGQLNPNSKEMEVCSVCGAFLVVGDAPSRQEEHLMGKQHMGYARVRTTIEKLESRFGRNAQSVDSNERSRDRSSRGGRDYGKDGNRDRKRRSRSRERRGRRSRSKSRERRKEKKRDRSRS